MIPVLRPSCSEAEVAAVTAVLRSNWWGHGGVCEQFEAELVRRSGYAHAVTVNSATAALHLAMCALGIQLKAGDNDNWTEDQVIVPALTFVSTGLAPLYCGARVVFADIDPVTLCIDWNDVQRKLTHWTRAIIPVDYAGYPADPGVKFAGIPIVEDASHMPFGAHYGALTCYSFHPVKPIATGDGGALLTNDARQAERLRALRWCGIDKSTWQRTGRRYSWDYAIDEIGYKCHWNDLQAAVGLAQLARYDELHARRRILAERYLAELGAYRDWQLPVTHPAHSWHLFALRVNATERDALLDHLAAAGISAGVHYKPLTYYKPFAQRTPPVTEREWRRLISLPLYADMTDAEQDQVLAALHSWRKVR